MEKKKEEKKKKKNRKIMKWIIGGSVATVCVAGVWYYLKKKYKSLPDEEEIGNMIESGEAIEVEPGRKIFLSERGYVAFVNEDDIYDDGVSVVENAFKKGIKTEDLESATGNPWFRIREGQNLQYRVRMAIPVFRALFGTIKAKSVTGHINLSGKFK